MLVMSQVNPCVDPGRSAWRLRVALEPRGTCRLVGLAAGVDRPAQWVRQLLGMGAIVRWVGLGVAGIVGVLAPPRAPALLVALILAVGAYNAASMLLVRRASDQSVLRIARTVTVLDEVGCLVFLAIFTGLPGGTEIAFYVPALWASDAHS